MVLDINWVMPMTPAKAKLPVIRYAMAKVAELPVTLQLIVLTNDLKDVSLNAHFLANFGC
jgi:hypothetical protein